MADLVGSWFEMMSPTTDIIIPAKPNTKPIMEPLSKPELELGFPLGAELVLPPQLSD
jgi:hypothetical protein